MARKPTIDREAVLIAAEDIVASKGAAALTIAAVAKAAGITKGGVQSCFGTKEALINAMLERWMRIYDGKIRSLVGDNPKPEKRIRAHSAVTLGEDFESQERTAALLAALLQSPEHLQATRNWYDELTASLHETTLDQSHLRIALFAIEGAYYLRHLGLMTKDDDFWELLRNDIDALLIK